MEVVSREFTVPRNDIINDLHVYPLPPLLFLVRSVGHCRTLHKWLLAMHFTAAVCMMAGVAKYCLPVSTMSCRVTGAVLIGTVLLYDVSFETFKNGH